MSCISKLYPCWDTGPIDYGHLGLHVGPRARDQGLGAMDQEPGTMGHWLWDQEPGTMGQKL